MSEPKKLFTAREAAQAVLNKAKEILKESTLMKAEKLNKYETDMKKEPSKPTQLPVKSLERDFNEYEVKSGSYKDSSGKRQEKQVSPSKNPKEEAEGNNKSDGMEPRYEFKDKISKELKKENEAAKGSPKDKNGNPGLGKSENPDKDEDAKLGEKVEKDVEEHFKKNKSAEEKEGHKLMTKSDGKSKFGRCVEDVKENSPEVKSPEAVCVAEGVKPEQQKSETDKNVIPRLIVSAKLAKFMEHMHSKRKNREVQGAEAVGPKNPGEPQQGSTSADKPDLSRPKTQPTDGDMDKSYEGFKTVENSARKSGAHDPAAVAAAAGREKYGKEAFQHAAAAGKKMGKK